MILASCDPTLTALFTPTRPHLGRYEIVPRPSAPIESLNAGAPIEVLEALEALRRGGFLRSARAFAPVRRHARARHPDMDRYGSAIRVNYVSVAVPRRDVDASHRRDDGDPVHPRTLTPQYNSGIETTTQVYKMTGSWTTLRLACLLVLCVSGARTRADTAVGTESRWPTGGSPSAATYRRLSAPQDPGFLQTTRTTITRRSGSCGWICRPPSKRGRISRCSVRFGRRTSAMCGRMPSISASVPGRPGTSICRSGGCRPLRRLCAPDLRERQPAHRLPAGVSVHDFASPRCALPASADELLRTRSLGWLVQYSIGDSNLDGGVPLVSAFRWDTGVQAHARVGMLSATASVTAGTISNPLFTDDNSGRQLAGRVELRPASGLILGTSVARGPFVGQSAARAALGDSQNGRFHTDGFWGRRGVFARLLSPSGSNPSSAPGACPSCARPR